MMLGNDEQENVFIKEVISLPVDRQANITTV